MCDVCVATRKTYDFYYVIISLFSHVTSSPSPHLMQLSRSITWSSLTWQQQKYSKEPKNKHRVMVWHSTCCPIHGAIKDFFYETRNAFCGTWYLPHSHDHNERTVPIIMAGCIAHARTGRISLPVKNLTSPSVPRPRFPKWRENFGNSAINKGYIAYFSLCMRETAVFPFLV